MEAMKSVTLGTGLFTVQVKMYKADANSNLSSKTFCKCAPDQAVLPKKEAFKSKLTTVYRCSTCGFECGHWSKAPRRGVVLGDDVYFFTQEELDAIELPAYGNMDILKVVPIGRVGIFHAFTGSYYLMPNAEADEPVLRVYRLLVDVLSRNGWAILTKLTMSKKVHRFAVIPDRELNILVALKIGDRRSLPHVVQKAPVDASTASQLESILRPFYTDEARLEADSDALTVLIQGKQNSRMREALGGTPEDLVAEMKADLRKKEVME